MPSVSAGSTRSAGSFQPDGLNHFSHSAKTSTSSGPSTNVGRQIPAIASDIGT